jgi:hypothetical protein
MEGRAAKPAPLPNAPTPQSVSGATERQTPAHVRTASGAPVGAKYAPLYDRLVFPDQIARRWTAKNKFIFAAQQTIEPINVAPALISAGYGQYSNDDPKYGTGPSAFGERFGAAVLRQDSYRMLADGLMPIVFREDPRYYRLGEGSLSKRFDYAVLQTFVTRTDGGTTVPNYAGILGRGIASSLTYTYYPAVSANARVVLLTFATSIAGDAALNVIRELTPEKTFMRLKALHLRFSGP